MGGLNFLVCVDCKARKDSSDFSARMVCNSCRRNSNQLFSSRNGMDLGSIPSQLRDLTLLEQLLIARVHPVVSLFKIRGQQRAYSGHVLNFVQRVEIIALRLPHNPGRLNAIVLMSRDTPDGVIHFRVRAMRVREASVWLKSNNQYYSDIPIDEALLGSLPHDGDMSASIQTIQASEGSFNESDERPS